jgi:uncharacterized lipoprotein
MAAVLMATASCSWFRHGSPKCHEPAMQGNLANGPPLQMPPGLDAPDTRGAVRIPQLTEPERPRSPNDPCLSAPPDYKTAQP